jgi:hypothetical protein
MRQGWGNLEAPARVISPQSKLFCKPLRPTHRKRCYGHLPFLRDFAREGEGTQTVTTSYEPQPNSGFS